MATVHWEGPRQSVVALAERFGRRTVVDACIDLLRGNDVDPQIIVGLGGPPARWAADGGAPGPDYWLRVWALRGLLWLWDSSGQWVVLDSLTDEAWRVREMAAKVVARHQLDDALEVLVARRDDPNARVRAAFDKAIQKLTIDRH